MRRPTFGVELELQYDTFAKGAKSAQTSLEGILNTLDTFSEETNESLKSIPGLFKKISDTGMSETLREAADSAGFFSDVILRSGAAVLDAASQIADFTGEQDDLRKALGVTTEDFISLQMQSIQGMTKYGGSMERVGTAMRVLARGSRDARENIGKVATEVSAISRAAGDSGDTLASLQVQLERSGVSSEGAARHLFALSEVARKIQTPVADMAGVFSDSIGKMYGLKLNVEDIIPQIAALQGVAKDVATDLGREGMEGAIRNALDPMTQLGKQFLYGENAGRDLAGALRDAGKQFEFAMDVGSRQGLADVWGITPEQATDLEKVLNTVTDKTVEYRKIYDDAMKLTEGQRLKRLRELESPMGKVRIDMERMAAAGKALFGEGLAEVGVAAFETLSKVTHNFAESLQAAHGIWHEFTKPGSVAHEFLAHQMADQRDYTTGVSSREDGFDAGAKARLAYLREERKKTTDKVRIAALSADIENIVTSENERIAREHAHKTPEWRATAARKEMLNRAMYGVGEGQRRGSDSRRTIDTFDSADALPSMGMKATLQASVPPSSLSPVVVALREVGQEIVNAIEKQQRMPAMAGGSASGGAATQRAGGFSLLRMLSGGSF